VRHIISLAVALAVSVAAAFELPRDATLFVTDTSGTIVGVGRLVAGETFEIDLAVGFGGAVMLTFVGPDGAVVVVGAVVDDGVVLLDLVDIAVLAAQAGFRAVRVSAADPAGSASADASDSGLGGGHASSTGSERAGDHPDERAAEGGGDADGERGPPGELPRDALELPIRAPELPVVPADPAAPTPERP